MGMEAMKFNPDSVVKHIVQWLLSYAQESRQKGWVIGVSGGIDSAVTSALCGLTGLPTTVVELPIHQHPDEVNRAVEHMDALCHRFPLVEQRRVDLTSVYDAFADSIPKDHDASEGLAFINARARLRMTTLYTIAAQRQSLVVGTGNRVEDFGVGFYTKYGDGGVDLSPIADLMKTEVFALGAFLDVPKSIQSAAPTDGLWGDDRTDEMQIGATYPELEWAMEHVGKIKNGWSARQEEVMEIYQRLHLSNQHKMRPIPVCHIPDAVRLVSF